MKDVQIKITKKSIIYLCIVFLLCVGSFCAGRFIRFGRISGTSQQLIDGVILSRETADKLADELNITRNTIQSTDNYGRAVLEGIEELRKSSELGRVCTNVIKQSIERDAKNNKDLLESREEYFDAVDYALELATKRAELYESIVRAYEQAVSNNGENSN